MSKLAAATHRLPGLGVSLALACALAGCGSPTHPSLPGSQTTSWSDEFNGPNNTVPDPSKWTYDLGAGWGNQELQTYTNLLANARMDGLGHLVIQAHLTSSGFTSARLTTHGLFAAQYGHIEARIKLPLGQGLWPAFWMLGNDCNEYNWPACGEIDVMENIGSEPNTIHGSLHGPGPLGGSAVSASFSLPNDAFSNEFHIFAVDWEPLKITFSVDNRPYQTVTPLSLPSEALWVFDKPFFLLLNVSVGGTYPGPPDSSTQFPQQMLVDYVRWIP